MAELPELRPPLVDSHVHLNHPRLRRRLPAVLARAAGAGVAWMLVVGYDLPSSDTAVALAREHANLWAAVGVHPHDAAGVDHAALAQLRQMAQSPKVVAIGETGLDFHRDLSPREAQLDAFRRQLDLAEECGLPAVVHCRAAQEPLLATLAGRTGLRAIWHCFDGSLDHARQALALGLTLGFTGMLTYRHAEALQQVAAAAPADRILVETDAPYLAPEPKRGEDNEPANLPLIVSFLAGLRGASHEDIARTTAENFCRVFSITA